MALDPLNPASRSTTPNEMIPHLTLSQALPSIPRLDPTGVNLAVWERQLKLKMSLVTGLDVNYLDAASSTAPDPDFDHIARSMIILSIAEPLRSTVDTIGTAREALRQLKNNFEPSTQFHKLAADHSTTPSSHETSSIDLEQIESLDEEIRHLREQKAQSFITATSPTFSGLPVEVLERIAHYVNALVPSETHAVGYQRAAREVSRLSSTGQEYYVYEANGVPDFNSLQSLACVNRTMYRLCFGYLWKHLRFPSSGASPVSRWTDDLLLKYGDLVESVSMLLERDWWQASHAPKNELDNLRIQHMNADSSSRYHQGISWKNGEHIMKMCPNVRSIAFKVSHYNTTLNGEESWSFYNRLGSILSRFPTLVHLAFSFGFNGQAPNLLATAIIKNLPLLESLKCENLVQEPFEQPVQTDTLVWHLSQLKHLSKLSLLSCDAVDGTWCEQAWPKTIKDLLFFNCRNLSIEVAQQLIPHMAPELIHLELRILPDGQHDADNAGNQPPAGQHQYNLPALRSLEIWNATTHLSLLNFQHCKNLRVVESWQMPLNVWTPIPHLIRTSTWPKLNYLDVQAVETIDDADWNTQDELVRTRVICDRNGIKLVYA